MKKKQLQISQLFYQLMNRLESEARSQAVKRGIAAAKARKSKQVTHHEHI